MNGKKARKLRNKAFRLAGMSKADRRINPDGKPNVAPVNPGESYFVNDNGSTVLETTSAKGIYRKLKKEYIAAKRKPLG
jgi:hypothetical protein